MHLPSYLFNINTSYSSRFLNMRQQLLYFRHLVLRRLRLVRPAADADVALNPHDAVGVQEAVGLPDYAHYFVPGSFCCECQRAKAGVGMMGEGELVGERVGERACLSDWK